MRKTFDSCDFLVAGGGLSGICAALQAARMGLKVIIAEKEMLLGGNAGPNMGIASTASHITNAYFNEMGIIEEIMEELYAHKTRMVPTIVNYNINPQLDTILAGMLEKEHIKLYRRHLVTGCRVENNRIQSVSLLNAENLDTVEVTVNGTAIDCTGDALLAQLAGADVAMGRESREETGERSAPEKADGIVSAASLTALVVDTGVECEFIPPPDTPEWNPNKPSSRFDPSHRVHFLWQVDEGGENAENHPFYSPQTLYLNLMKRIYSQWNYLKNIRYPEELRTHQLVWISPILGRRESYRILGDYLLTQTDIESCRAFEDTVAFGGSFLDEHLPSFDGGYEVRYYARPMPYDIPYRCIYSRNIENLFSGGRAVGVSHLAFTSVRLIRTGCSLAQAAGVAAALCSRYGCTPREVGVHHLEELQQTLLRYDAHIPGLYSKDEADLARSAKITASSELSLDGAETPVGEWHNAKDGVEALLFSYPEKLESCSVYLSNPGEETTLELNMRIGRTQDQEFWPAPETWVDEKGQFHEAQGEIAPEGTDEIKSVMGCRNYFIRRDALTEFTSVAVVRKTVPAGFRGYFKLDLPAAVLEQPERRVWRQALALRFTGGVEILLAKPAADVAEGIVDGAQTASLMPVLHTQPPIMPGAAWKIADGFNHRSGQQDSHAWISQLPLPQSIMLEWPDAKSVSQVLIRFDITERLWKDMYIARGLNHAQRLARSFVLEGRDEHGWHALMETEENHLRFVRVTLPERQMLSALRLTVRDTWGGGEARVNEIRVYGERIV